MKLFIASLFALFAASFFLLCCSPQISLARAPQIQIVYVTNRVEIIREVEKPSSPPESITTSEIKQKPNFLGRIHGGEVSEIPVARKTNSDGTISLFDQGKMQWVYGLNGELLGIIPKDADPVAFQIK